jgi:large subunit ribosomal protein L28
MGYAVASLRGPTGRAPGYSSFFRTPFAAAPSGNSMRKCSLTGKRRNMAMQVSHSHIRTHKVQLPNVQWKRVWYEEGNRFVRLHISTRALRTIAKKGLTQFLRDENLSLSDVLG